MDAGQDNHVGIGRGGTLRQRQGIPDNVGDAVEDFRRLVVVRQNAGITRFTRSYKRRVRSATSGVNSGDSASAGASSAAISTALCSL